MSKINPNNKKEKKDTYYFSHDYYARNDENILMLRAEEMFDEVIGKEFAIWAYYGIYWALVEMMHESAETALYHNKIKGYAINLNLSENVLKQVIDILIKNNLFVSDKEVFYSESAKRRKETMKEKSKKRAEAGKKGAESRYGDKPEPTAKERDIEW